MSKALWLARTAGRILAAAFGAVLGAAGVALFEAVRGARAWPVRAGDLFVGELAVLIPLAGLLAASIAAAALVLDPFGTRGLGNALRRTAALEPAARDRLAAFALILPGASLLWALSCAYAARDGFARGAPYAAGPEVAAVSLVSLAFLLAIALALVPGVGRLLGGAVSPAVGSLCGATYAVVALTVGIHIGDVSGEGPAPLAILGVLARPELDLTPVAGLAIIAALALGLERVAAEHPAPSLVWSAAFGVAASAALVVYEASALNEDARVVRAIETTAPLGRIGLALARRVTDRDRDGASALFGGGDCDDHDPRRSPLADDIPGNGLDEDCSGKDAPLSRPVAKVSPRPPEPLRAPGRAKGPASETNLVLITIDTLRIDLGFMGYSRPVSPNLDALAARSTVFERAYSMASYTGKSVGPTMIGKYPSECFRDGAHFDTYFPENTFLAERLEDAGFRTMGAASHWYFQPKYGLTQGMETWDTSALPAAYGRDADSSVTSATLTDAAIRLLSDPKNVSHRFFMWVHYFDPHANYVAHAEAPDFRQGAKSWAKAAYDGEVWFTDHHLGRLFDFIASQPFGDRTILAVTADHGEAFEEHGMSWHGVDLWEPLVRVPLIIHVPGAGAHRVAVKRSLIDLVPTLLELLGLPPPGPGELSGESMASSIAPPEGSGLAEGAEPPEERDVYMDMPAGPQVSQHRALIHGVTPGLKLLSEGGPVYFLFDLSRDPGELNELSRDRAGLLEMKGIFEDKLASLHALRIEPAPYTVR